MERIEDKENTTQLKKTVRRKILTLRNSIRTENKAQYDAVIREIVTGMAEYGEAEVILAYVSYKSEVDTTLLIKQALKDGKAVFVPKVADCEMEFWKIESLSDLQEGYKGIREPVQNVSFSEWIKKYCTQCIEDSGKDIHKDTIEDNAICDDTAKACKIMMWMPGAVFDKDRHRIGYGGGFYDRYLGRLAGNTENAVRTWDLAGQVSFITAALAYSCQILEQIPHEEHDRKPDLIITEQGIIG